MFSTRVHPQPGLTKAAHGQAFVARADLSNPAHYVWIPEVWLSPLRHCSLRSQ